MSLWYSVGYTLIGRSRPEAPPFLPRFVGLNADGKLCDRRIVLSLPVAFILVSLRMLLCSSIARS